ncbi:hypothetical protein THF5H11_40405 [Vibrio jasicida]|uniref:Uncharacterized protein n=1 Tax=Vibrio jasicida TaxID=766224 RepID=A0AAU9QYC1_9VIBR|nr:hypothetical protein THF5H11_40405 [Vibrio jasicida]CAH1601355.1 hypothetical protein THF1C08_70036 [Vibrio jasicida]CAH1602570.1 hypothetical protein THF1A12_60038 [Vibrio jasicida]
MDQGSRQPKREIIDQKKVSNESSAFTNPVRAQYLADGVDRWCPSRLHLGR